MFSHGEEADRLFIALSLTKLIDDSTFNAVLRKLKSSAGKAEIPVRWIPAEDLHLTLLFLGSRRMDERTRVIEAARRVAAQFNPLELELRNVGAFPGPEGARVLWLGAAKSAELLRIQGALESQFGMEAQGEEFTPHVTLGRLRNLKNVKDLISPVVRARVGKHLVEEIVLFKSEVFGPRVVYTAIERIALQV